MRRTKKYKVDGQNPLWNIKSTVSLVKVWKNTLIIEISRYIASMPLKRKLLLHTGMKIGDSTSIAFKVTPDIMYPELITIGHNCVVGFNSTLLCHEYLVDEYRIGEIIIGNRVMIGANTTILPGVTIGDNAVVGAGSVVSKDIPADSIAYGSPIQIRKKG